MENNYVFAPNTRLCWLLVLLTCLLAHLSLNAQTHHRFWTDDGMSSKLSRQVLFDLPLLQQQLTSSPKTILELPLPDGTDACFTLKNSPLLPPNLQAQYPSIQGYAGQAIFCESTTGSMRLALSTWGVYAFIDTPEGMVILSPVSPDQPTRCEIRYAKPEITDFVCRIEENIAPPPLPKQQQVVCLSNGNSIREYTLAVAATSAFSANYGGTVASATAQINAVLSAVNLIYERDLAMRFVLPANNNNIIYTNSGSDPFSGISQDLLVAHSVINTNIGSGNYDAGIVMDYGFSGGSAGVGAACNPNHKAKAWMGDSGNLSQFIITVSHEVGHLFSATHSFFGNENYCSQRSVATAYEPGGGSTIMGYPNVCGTQNIAASAGQYFHIASLIQISNFIATSSCATITSSTNNIPTANASPLGATYTIPRQTPFVLTGSGSDSDSNDVLTYCWEEYDTDPTSGGAAPNAAANTTNAPLFRSFSPTTSPIRYFPQLSDLANNTQTIGEILPAVSRNINMRLTVRDNHSGGGGVACDETTVAVNASAGPFAVTSPNTTGITWTANGSNTQTVTWNVAGTTAAPISCSQVDIYLSTDGGYTYPHLLANNVSNNGSATILVPNYPTYVGRIMVKCADNIFFDVSNVNFSITSSCSAEGTTIAPTNTVTALAGSPSLNLSLSPQYGTNMSSINGSLTAADPSNTIAVENNGSSCINFGNAPKYETFTFQVNTLGNYTFTLSASGFSGLITLYANNYSPASPCNNQLDSNGNYNGSNVIISSSFTETLTPGITYVLVTSGFTSNNTIGSYTVTFTPPAGSGIYTGTPPPGASFGYTYVIVNNDTGIIMGVNADADLSNSNIFGAGTYSVYGLSYQTSSLPNPAILVAMPFESLQNSIASLVYCANLSDNAVTAIIQSNCSPPTTPAAISGNTSLCGNATNVTYSVPSVGGATSYTWTLPTGASIASGNNTNSISVNFNNVSGNICVTANNACGSSVSSCLGITLTTVPATCDDSDCTTNDTFNSTLCQCEHTPITPPTCNDNDVCTNDTYNAAICTCEFTPIEDCISCDNNSDCIPANSCETCICQTGVCVCSPIVNINWIPSAATPIFGLNVAVLTFSGGVPPYSQQWETTSGYSNRRNLSNGSVRVVYNHLAQFSVTVTDANGCSNTLSISPNLPLSLGTPIITPDTNNNNGSINISPSGGDLSCGIYTYTWSGNSINAGNQHSQDVSSLDSGWYQVTVTDCAGNSVSNYYWVAAGSNR